MNELLLNGRWPGQGASEEEIREILEKKLGLVASWGETPILGFPSMSPHPLGIEAFIPFQEKHANAILCHTRTSGEKGFSGVQDLERQVIYMVADLLGAKRVWSEERKQELPDVDGYIAPGGTEANIMGIWVGREHLRQTVRDPGDRRVAVLASPASHYSLSKACCVTDLGGGIWEECVVVDPQSNENVRKHFIPSPDGSGLHFVRSNAIGQIDIQALEEKVRWLRAKHNICRFIIFLNEGTTMTGAMDDTAAVGLLVTSLRQEWGSNVGFYIHVDAAYGGFLYPFLLPDQEWGFKVPEVDSLTVDPYKMGQCPMAEGIFLCRKNLTDHISRATGYVRNNHDDTLCGSRSGAYAAACWAVFCREGFVGFESMHRQSVAMAGYLHQQLSQLPHICVLEPQLNMVAFGLPHGLSGEILRQVETTIIEPFHAMWDWFTPDPEGLSVLPSRLVKCNITRDVKKEWIDQFVDSFRSVLEGVEVH